MPGLLDFAQQAGQQAEGLGDLAATAQGNVYMRRRAEKEAAQQGLGQLAGVGLAYAATKRRPKQDNTAVSQILGQIGTNLMSHWMPAHGTYSAFNQTGMSPETGFQTTPQDGGE